MAQSQLVEEGVEGSIEKVKLGGVWGLDTGERERFVRG